MVFFLGSRWISLSDISFIVQVLVFFLLVYSITGVKNNLPKHGKIATISFLIALISILYMIYSLLNDFSAIVPTELQLLVLVHKLMGFFAIILAMVFVANQWKWKVKKNMIAAFVIWIGALILGIILYVKLFIGI